MRCFQIPLTPGFAMTAHKAQGLTLPRVIVDFVSCRGMESPYVMASRCTSLDGILIIRLFPTPKTSCHRSQEARDEFTRLDLAHWQTITTHGTTQERASAREHLSTRTSGSSTQIEDLFTSGGSTDPTRAAQLLQRLQNNDDQAEEGIL